MSCLPKLADDEYEVFLRYNVVIAMAVRRLRSWKYINILTKYADMTKTTSATQAVLQQIEFKFKGVGNVPESTKLQYIQNNMAHI